MPRQPCYWTRKLELELVEFVKNREVLWKPSGNTNHHIQQKYKAYAEFAAKSGRAFTARSVRDRWVNIRSTFNHNLRKVDKTKETATSPEEVYVPCWPLWESLQFLRDVMTKKDFGNFETCPLKESNCTDIDVNTSDVKQEVQSDFEDNHLKISHYKNISIDKSNDIYKLTKRRTDRPRHKICYTKSKKSKKCDRIIDDLIQAMKPLTKNVRNEDSTYWFFGRHVTERLNSMREEDAKCASRDIFNLIHNWPMDVSCKNGIDEC